MTHDLRSNCSWGKYPTVTGLTALLVIFTSFPTFAARIDITTDTTTELTGTFFASTHSCQTTDFLRVAPSNFDYLPGPGKALIVGRFTGVANLSFFGSLFPGLLDDPFFIVRNSRFQIGNVSGTYRNSGPGRTLGPAVDYSISYLDSGTFRNGGGILIGKFSFLSQTNSVPDGGTTALLLGISLLGFLTINKLMRPSPET